MLRSKLDMFYTQNRKYYMGKFFLFRQSTRGINEFSENQPTILWEDLRLDSNQNQLELPSVYGTTILVTILQKPVLLKECSNSNIILPLY